MADRTLIVLYLVLAFVAGFSVSLFFDVFSGGGITGRSIDVPSDRFTDKNILVYDDKIVIKIVNAQVTNYDSTGSMLPTLGYGVNGISVKPETEEDIGVGDIVSFWKGEKLVVHRVVEKGTDAEGIYFITKGDNAPIDDGKVRFGEIEHVLVGLIY